MNNNQPVFVIGAEGQRCTPGKALENHNLSIGLRGGYDSVLNQLESEGRHNEVRAIRQFVARLVWWAQEEQIAAAKARELARDISANYDHSRDGHKYDDGSCQVCKAEIVLS